MWPIRVVTLGMMIGITAAAQQLPPEAIQLDKVKIAEQVTAAEFDPVTLEKADPDLPTWEYEGVTYGSSAEDSQAKFQENPEKYHAEAQKERWVYNFMHQMSRIWCPVTDEIGPGNLLEWQEQGFTWESCCTFCNQTVQPEHFPRAVDRLRKRAEKSYALQEGRYVEGASSPVEGAIDFDATASNEPMVHEGSGTDHEVSTGGVYVPEWVEEADWEPTYAGGVAEIMERRCLECHRMGSVAPMPLVTYQDVRKWSTKMREVIKGHTMPPWPADPKVGTFSNSKYLTDKEYDLLLEWIDARFPRGEGEYTPKLEWAGEWTIGEPDEIFELEEYEIPADVIEEIAEFSIETSFDEDKWIVKSEALPSDRFLVKEIMGAPLGHYTPGQSYEELPPGQGRLLKAGETVKANIHYIKEKGWEEYDASRFAVVFADDPSTISTSVLTDPMRNDTFVLPAGEADVEVVSEFTFEKDGKVLAVTPVMHSRGHKLHYTVTTPDGEETTVLSIPKWDPKWQFTYRFAEPIDAPKGTMVKLVATFDNSENNPLNLNPDVEVKAGPNGEILEGWLDYTLD